MASTTPTRTHAPFDVIALGELLVDLTERSGGQGGAPVYERNPGGAPANLAAACTRLGLNAALVGKVGDDPMGAVALEALRTCGVDTSFMQVDATVCTTLALASLIEGTDSYAYSFVRKPGADQMLRPGELPAEAIRAARVLHVGSLSLTHEPARSATLEAVRLAREAGALVSYDPNHRPHAWDSPGDALEQMLALLPSAELLKVGDSEAELLCRELDANTPAAETPGFLSHTACTLRAAGPRLVAITCGARGAYLQSGAGEAWVPAVPAARVCDTTGAGDNFWGAALAWLLREGRVARAADLDALDTLQLAACGAFACHEASRSVELPGGMHGQA